MPPLSDAVLAVPDAAAGCGMSERLEVRCASNANDLSALRHPWDQLAGGIPFRRWQWLVPWWNHFRGPRDELLVLTVTNGAGQVVGIAPWFTRDSVLRGRVIHFLGTGLVSSDYVTILHAPAYGRAVAEALASWLHYHGPRYSCVELNGVSAEDDAVRHFSRQLEAREHVVDRKPEESCWRIDLPDAWEHYLQRLSKSRREKARQLIRRTLDTDRADVRVADSRRTLEEGLDVLADLHQRRRTSLGQPGCFASPQFRGFLDEVAHRFFDLGQLRLQWVELDARPVVAEIDFTDEHTVYMYQSGMDPEFAPQRPGWLGTIASLRHAIDAGYRHYDFLRGNEPYKAHWRAEPGPLTLQRLYPKSARARLARALSHARTQVGRCIKATVRRAGE